MTDIYWLAIHPNNPPRGYWDHGLLERLFQRLECQHFMGDIIPEENNGGIVVIPARNQVADLDRLNFEILKLKWCVVILSGDEESVFPWRDLHHPNMRIWIMSPKQGIHDDAAGRLGSGFRFEQPDIMAEIGMLERDLDWSFAGQVNHPTRSECANALKDMPNGELKVSSGFGQGLQQRKYLELLARSKFVPCPAGPATPDTFRLFEALEAGCIPIGDSGDYWSYLFGEPVPFPIVSSWDALPTMLPQLLRSWKPLANKVFAWWQGYKLRMADKLCDHIQSCSGEYPVRVDRDDTVVLISSSPVPSHPSTEMVNKTVLSVRERLPQSRIIVMIDGISAESVERFDDYTDYTARILWETNNEMHNATPLVMDVFSHQTGMTREAMRLFVRESALLFVEHDTPLVNEVDFDKLREIVLSGYANTIRLLHEAQILPDHEHLMLDKEPQEILGVPLVRTIQWSQRPHLSATSYYREICQRYWDHEPRFIEHVMYGVVLENEGEHWKDHLLHIYAPSGPTMLRSGNLNGRVYQAEGKE